MEIKTEKRCEGSCQSNQLALCQEGIIEMWAEKGVPSKKEVEGRATRNGMSSP